MDGFNDDDFKSYQRKRQRRHALKPNSAEAMLLHEFSICYSLDSVKLKVDQSGQLNTSSSEDTEELDGIESPEAQQEDHQEEALVAAESETILPPCPPSEEIDRGNSSE